MAKNKKISVIKKILVVGVVLGLFQVAYIYLNKGGASKTIRQAIDERVGKMSNLSPERRAQVRVQLAINDFMQSNRGKPPGDLKVLIPKYFDRLPVDPSTNKPFEYSVEGQRYRLGTGETAVAMNNKKSGQQNEDGGTEKADDQADLIAMLDLQGSRARYVYDPTNKRDPFKPFDFAPDPEDAEDRTPLERFPISSWRMTAVLDVFGEPAAIVESQGGRGYTVKIGTKIGRHDGKVIDIQADRIIVLEEETDFAGEKQTRRVEIPMKSGG